MARARFQEGSLIVEGKTPFYYVRFRVYNDDGTSKQKKTPIGLVSKISKREANKLKSQIVAKETQQLPQIPSGQRGDMLFKDFYNNRFLVMKTDWSDAHRDNFKFLMERFVLPKFGDLPLSGIDKVMVQSRLNSLSPQYSKSTIRHIRAKIVEVLGEALEQEFITRNPAAKTKIPSDARAPQQPIMTEEQLIGIMDRIKDKRDRAIFFTGTFCALRTSEVFGMPWKNFHEEDSNFMVDQIAFEGVRYERTKNTASKAKVPIGEQTLQVILEWKAECKDTMPDALMFPSTNRNGRSKKGAPMCPGIWLQKRLQPIAEAVGIPFKVNFRATRRTASSLLQGYGAALATAQGLLRHASATTTANIYSKAVPDSVRMAVNDYESRVFAARPKPKLVK